MDITVLYKINESDYTLIKFEAMLEQGEMTKRKHLSCTTKLQTTKQNIKILKPNRITWILHLIMIKLQHSHHDIEPQISQSTEFAEW